MLTLTEKKIFHSSLMKSIDTGSGEKDRGLFVDTAEETEENNRDGSFSNQKTTSTSANKDRVKTLTFKSAISTPTNDFKSSLTTAKLLKARKSHDMSYLMKQGGNQGIQENSESKG